MFIHIFQINIYTEWASKTQYQSAVKSLQGLLNFPVNPDKNAFDLVPNFCHISNKSHKFNPCSKGIYLSFENALWRFKPGLRFIF